MAWIIRGARKLLQLRTKPVAATVSLVNPEEKVPHLLLLDVEKAERIIVRNVQIQTFPEEPRVVFDCACKSSGVSLNNQLLQGPENTSSLIGVILRFRVNSVAVAADIKRMFHQVFVSPEDRGALCYLWWPDGDLTKDPKTFQMLVHIFGATSSPSICGYALRRTAADYSEGFSSQTIDAVMRDFYVDDLLKSFETTGQAVETTKELQELLAKGGFQLTKVMSNERQVLNAFPPEHRAPAVKDLDINLNSLPMDRALGIHWDMEADTFNLVVSDKSHPGTRKGVLSSIATIYDPLGLVGPLILPGREINQELCRLKYDWNDRLPDELAVKWRDWKEGLASLTGYSIPRSFTPRVHGEEKKPELVRLVIELSIDLLLKIQEFGINDILSVIKRVKYLKTTRVFGGEHVTTWSCFRNDSNRDI